MRNKEWWRGGRRKGQEWIRSNGKLNLYSVQGCMCVQLFVLSPDGEGWGPVAGAESCALCIPAPGMCQESINAVSTDVYQDIKEQPWRKPQYTPRFPLLFVLWKLSGLHLPSGTWLPLCWQHTLEIKEHEFWSQSLVQTWLCNLAALALGQVPSLFYPLPLISKTQIQFLPGRICGNEMR